VRNGVCSVCGALRAQTAAEHDERRGSSRARGYDYRWEKVRRISPTNRCAGCAGGWLTWLITSSRSATAASASTMPTYNRYAGRVMIGKRVTMCAGGAPG
jgi:hypothetical protein